MKNSVELHNALLTAEDFGRGKISYTTRGLRVFVPSSAKASVPEAMRVASLADVDWSPVDRLWVPEPFADAFCETDIPATVAIIRGLPLHLAAFLPLSISALGHVCVPTRVTENLFLGCVESSKDERLLSSLSISAIVDASLQSTTGRRFEGIEYLTLDIADRTDVSLSEAADRTIAFAAAAMGRNGKVLIHCQAGISRSASLCLFFLMHNDKMTLKEAWDLLVACRPIVSPNPSFICQLIAFEKHTFGQNSVRVPTEEEINDKWEPVTIHHLVVDQKKRKMLSSSSEVDVDYGDVLDLDGQKDIAKDPSASK